MATRCIVVKLRPLFAFLIIAVVSAQAPHPIPGGFSLPNGWRITPAGKAIATQDLILNLAPSKDQKIVVAQHGGVYPHGVFGVGSKKEEALARVGLGAAGVGVAGGDEGA